MKLSPREKRLLLMLAFLVAALGFYRLIWQGTLPQYWQVQQALTAERTALNQAQIQAAGVEELRRQVDEARRGLSSLRRKFGAGPGEPLRQILTGISGEVRLEEVVPEQPVKKEFYTALPVRLRVSGPYPTVEAFLGRLEAFPAYLRELRVAAAGENGREVTAEIYLDLFTLKATGTPVPAMAAGGTRNPFLPLALPAGSGPEGGTARVGGTAPLPKSGEAKQEQPPQSPSQAKASAATEKRPEPPANVGSFPASRPAGRETRYDYSFPEVN